ncbi:polyphosphate kinase 2 family protein [Rummeliibacillus sp. JY-2-4R]
MIKHIEDMNLELHLGDKISYKKELEKLQFEMLTIQQFLFSYNIGLIIGFEGMDAAGKGGAIKRLTKALDPRGYTVHPIAAPTEEELKYHYLSRFWKRLPAHGQIGIFDRTWYGRVLVERIEGFANKDEWGRAYEEINQFEKSLTMDGYIVLKFWIQVSYDEQLKRFKERQENPYKKWKLTDEDWRNREKWSQYVDAANDMMDKTNKKNAPWIQIAGNDKKYARIQVLEETIKHIKKECKLRGLQVPKLSELTIN